MKKSIFILLFIILSGIIFGQKAEFKHILYKQLNQSDGLANNSLLTITQDDKGYIWVVTLYDGIQRYDGVRFQRFGQQFVDTISHFSKVRNLNFEHGQLIAQVDDSYYRFNYSDGKFYEILVGTDKKHSFVNIEGTRFTLTPIYVKLEYVQTPERNIILKLPSPNAGSRSYVAYDQYDGKYWVAYYGQLVSLDIKSGKAVLVSQDNNPELYELYDKMGRHGFSNIYCDTDRNLWLNNWDGVLARYNLNTRKYYFYSMETGRRTNIPRNYNAGVTAFFEDNHHQVWLGSLGAGLLKYDKEEDLFRFFASDGKTTEDIFNSEIRAFYQDKHENIWLGTSNGIRIFNPYRPEITVLNVRIKDIGQAITRNNSIEYAVQLKNGDNWVATWGNGVIVYDAELRIKKHYLFDDETSNMVWTIIEDKDDMVWLGCQAGKVRRFNKKTQRFEPPMKILDNISTIHCSLMDEVGNIYFGMNNGSIAKWDKNHKKFSLKQNGEKTQGVSRMITSFKLDSNQKLWARTQRYLYCFDNKSLVCKDSIPLVPLHQTIYEVGIEQGMTQYNDSLFVLASYFGKFGIFNVKSKNFAPFTLKENLALERILEVRKDSNGNIWFTTSNALYRLNPHHKLQLNNFVAENGLITSSFSKSSSSVLLDGRWMFYTNSDLLIFDPLDFDKLKDQHNIRITNLRIFDKELAIDSFFENKHTLNLNYRQNYISFDFTPMAYLPLFAQRYEYKLTGINQDWLLADNNFSITYTKLEPGNYTFMVRPEGVDDEVKIAKLSFVITPPFWRSWWFITILSILAATSAIIIARNRLNTIRRQSDMKRKILETEMAALRAQMNPHFIFNCLTAIDHLIQNDEKEKATSYLSYFAKLIRNVLDSTKNNTIPFYKDYDTIRLFIELEKFRSSNNFSYHLVADDELLQGDYKVPPMLIQPFIENAIHHGLRNKIDGEKTLDVRIKLEHDFIIYTITDSGVGREKAAQLKQVNRPEHVSYGIQISKERLLQFNFPNLTSIQTGDTAGLIKFTDLYDKGQACGTKVEIHLKIDPTKN